jgi:hypothetical protein
LVSEAFDPWCRTERVAFFLYSVSASATKVSGVIFSLSPPTTLGVGIASSTFVDLRRAFDLVVLAAVVGIPVACGGGRLVASQLFDTRRLWF